MPEHLEFGLGVLIGLIVGLILGALIVTAWKGTLWSLTRDSEGRITEILTKGLP